MNNQDFASDTLRVLVLVASLGTSGASLAGSPRFTLEAEAGGAWQQRNDARIANEAPNTRIDLAELTGDGPYAVGRLAFGWQINAKHGLRLLVAPLEIEESGRLAQDEVFREREFAAGANTRATYRFDSYRLTYLYTLRDDASWHLRVGGSLKIRDAEIGLGQEGVSARKTNTGLVPLLAFVGAWRFAPGWQAVLDAEGAAASQGRAFDVALKLQRELGDHWSLAGGYRLLDGGADNDELYTFARFDYAVLSLQYRW